MSNNLCLQRHSYGYICTLRDNHEGLHNAQDPDGNVVKEW